MRRLWYRIPLTLLLVAVSVGPSQAVGAKSPHGRGQQVAITGTVVDQAGRTLGEVAVVLTAGKRRFALGSFRRHDTAEATVGSVSDRAGSFSLGWTWNPYYNVFRLEALIRLRGAHGVAFDHVVGTFDITDAVRRGSPAGLELVVDRLDVLEEGRAFLASLDSGDLKSTYKDMGKPDRVDRLELTQGVEVAWWYFERGRSYHFLDGALVSKVDFEPVRRF